MEQGLDAQTFPNVAANQVANIILNFLAIGSDEIHYIS